MKIRSAHVEDALPVARIIVDIFAGTHMSTLSDEALQQRKQDYENSARYWRKIIEDIALGASPLSCVYVAEDGMGEVIGMSYACPSKDETRPEHVGELDMLYIQESHQRQGIGTALVQVTAVYMASVGMTKLHICTPTEHTLGRRFYDKLGGRVVGTRDDYDNGEVIPLVVYEWADIHALVTMGKPSKSSEKESEKEKVFRTKIRPAKIEDAPAMARVIVDTFLATNRGVLSEEALRRREQEWTHEVSARNWRETMQEMEDGISAFSCLYVAEDETGAVVGLSLGCPSKDEEDPAEVGEIDILYVSESHQRRGIGRALAQTTAAHLARLGMTKLHICTPAANEQGRRFYDKLGGHVVGMRDDYDDGELIKLVVYEWADIHTFVNMNPLYLK